MRRWRGPSNKFFFLIPLSELALLKAASSIKVHAGVIVGIAYVVTRLLSFAESPIATNVSPKVQLIQTHIMPV